MLLAGCEKCVRSGNLTNASPPLPTALLMRKIIYYRASSLRVGAKSGFPSLVIHAEDDPFIPDHAIAQYGRGRQSIHPSSSAQTRWTRRFHLAEDGDDPDRFWAENRVIEFCKLATETL